MQQRSEPSQSKPTALPDSPRGSEPSQSAPVGRVQIPLFVTYGDIFPRSGGSLSSQGELFGIFRQVEQNLPLRGRWHGASRDGEGSARLRQAALPPQRRAFAESGAADDYPFRHRLRRCHTPPFVAARHLPPERGKSALKGTAFSGGGKVSGSTQRLPLGGAGALAPEGVTPPVKMQSRSVRRRSGFALLKIIFPLFMRRAARRAFQIVPLPASHFSASASLHSTQCRGRNSRHAGGAAV